MLGHVPLAISDLYTSPDPANLGLALRSTQEIIDEIEALAPALAATIPRGQMHHARSDGTKTSDFSDF